MQLHSEKTKTTIAFTKFKILELEKIVRISLRNLKAILQDLLKTSKQHKFHLIDNLLAMRP